MTEIQKGVYRDLKGDLYHVIGEAVHTETNEVTVLYRRLNDLFDTRKISSHPKKLFLEQILYEGRHVLRFTYQG
jgi:hypothetical protein